MKLLEHPLPIAFLIYISLCSIIIYIKPRILFTTSSTTPSSTPSSTPSTTITNEVVVAHKTIWLFFILLAILVYSLVSVFISHKNRNSFLAQLK